MGVIKKMLYRSNILGKQRHQHFFLDMEENIHIHYRDLRIELSRGEFEDICDAFRKQSQELETIINEKNYQDGNLPNANQDDVRIWTESLLKHDVKYHQQRFSLEECSDGFHFHCRNYKLLFNETEFRQIAKLFKNLDVDSPYASTYDEVLELLEDNDVDFTLDVGNIPGELLAIAVAAYHFPKIREIFKLIGFTLDAQKYEHRYQGPALKVVAKVNNQLSTLDYKRIRGNKSTERLVDFLSRNASAIDPDALNRIKCQVLDLYFALSTGKQLNVDVNQQSWLYSPANQQVIFPYSVSARSKTEAAALYKTWADFLVSLKLWFVKPTKINFAPPEQAALQQQVANTLRNEVAAFSAVGKVYLMGSALRGEMGHYLAPFVNGPQVKLGSDVDILIEIDPAREADIPSHWSLIKQNEPSNQCAIYHIKQIPIAGGIAQWQANYPHLPLIEHLIDAYVFFPSRGHQAEKDAFLKKFNAQLFYDRARDGTINRQGEEANIALRIAELYALPQVAVEKMSVATENALYKVFSGKHNYVLKLFKVSGNYQRNRIAAHTVYEGKLITQLKERGILTAGIIPAAQGSEENIEGHPSLLFERINGIAQLKPEYPLDKTCAALAQIHQVQIERALNLNTDFSYEDICSIWLPLFNEYLNNTTNSPEIAEALAKFVPLSERFDSDNKRNALYASVPFVHNHGDVTPKNVITGERGEAIFFDFNNAYFGPRIADVLDGAFEFSLAEQYIHLADFSRFDAFISAYADHSPLTLDETKNLEQWVELVGLIKFTREIRALLEHPSDELRRKRALAIAEFVLARAGLH
ncbi:MAG: putative homoserine kinase type II [Gallionellaceae bacterium]|nr:MAG: putative homoserine kinase type II [Gallionellaceae bacterium]